MEYERDKIRARRAGLEAEFNFYMEHNYFHSARLIVDVQADLWKQERALKEPVFTSDELDFISTYPEPFN